MRLFIALLLANVVLIGSVSKGQAPPAPIVVRDPAARASATPRAGTARIRGRVTMVESGLPLRRATVLLTLTGSPPNAIEVPRVATDEQGYYEFRALPAGRYTLLASKTGFMNLAYGQRRALEPGRPIELANAQLLENIDFALPRGGTIVARVTNEFGDPLSGLTVQVLQYRFSGGERRLLPILSAQTGGDFDIRTNDLGEQRVFGLPPGEYYVGVSAVVLGAGSLPPADKGRVYAPTFYPGTASLAEAQRVALGIGQEVRVAFPLLPMRAMRVSGTVQTSDGRPFPRPGLTLVPRSADRGPGNPRITAQPDGAFVAPVVFPGEYLLSALPALVDASAPAEYARTPVTVADRDITGLVITTSKLTAVRGRFVFDTGTPPAGLRPADLMAVVSFPQMPFAGIGGTRSATQRDWTFEIPGVAGPDALFRLNATSAPGWFVKSVMLDGRDITDLPMDLDGSRDISGLEVVLQQKRAGASGGVVDAQNAPATDYVALLFPEDRALWTARSRFIATARPDQKGQFKIDGLPPGQYLAAAVEYLETGSERDPEILARLMGQAQKVTLSDGETKEIALKLVTY